MPVDPHAATHIDGGSDVIDGDRIEISYEPQNYTRFDVPDEVDQLDQLTAHLYGIDAALYGIATPSHDVKTTAKEDSRVVSSSSYINAIADGAKLNNIAYGGHYFIIFDGSITLEKNVEVTIAFSTDGSTEMAWSKRVFKSMSRDEIRLPFSIHTSTVGLSIGDDVYAIAKASGGQVTLHERRLSLHRMR